MIRLEQTRRAPSDSIVPMINVAFLLLIFFLMTAVIAPPDPVDVTPPEAASEPGEATPDALVVTAKGETVYGALRGDAVFGALPNGPLRLRADAALDAEVLARLVGRLQAVGVTRIELVTLRR